MIRILRSLQRDQGGNSLVEMGLMAPVLAALLVGTVDISQAVSTKVQVEQAAQRAIELAQRSNYATSMNATLKSEAETAAGSGSSATVTAWLECNHSGSKDYDTGTCTSAQSYARYVSVTVTGSYTPIFPNMFFTTNSNGTVTVKGYAVIRTQ
jgi:Flp pilus assembly protein TadG